MNSNFQLPNNFGNLDPIVYNAYPQIPIMNTNLLSMSTDIVPDHIMSRPNDTSRFITNSSFRSDQQPPSNSSFKISLGQDQPISTAVLRDDSKFVKNNVNGYRSESQFITQQQQQLPLALPSNISHEDLMREPNHDATFIRTLHGYILEFKKKLKKKKKKKKTQTQPKTSNNEKAELTKIDDKISITSTNKKSLKSSIVDENICNSDNHEQNIKKITYRTNGQENNILEEEGITNKIKNIMKDTWDGSDKEIDESESKNILQNLRNSIEKSEGSIDFEDLKNQIKSTEDINNIVKDVQENEHSRTDDFKDKSKSTPRKQKNEDELYEKHYSQEDIDLGLTNGTLIKNTIRISLKNTKEAYVSDVVNDKDIFIDGLKERNRALDGDEVVVELYSEEKWKRLLDGSLQKCGKVVGITKIVHSRTIVGYLKINYKKSGNIYLWPRDSRLPKIRVLDKSCPPQFRRKQKRYNNCLFLATITSWESTNFADGYVIRMIGEDNELEIETECILLENDLNVSPIENEKELIANFSDEIPLCEFEKREDIRSTCVFTVDPSTAKDLDDALSYRTLANDNCEVGVHIADVSHYVEYGSPIDKYIQTKANTVYLVQKAYHMLPEKLCKICSLIPGVDKLAFSVFVKFNADAEVVSHRFSKTIIRSCAQLSYEHAQTVIDSGNTSVNYECFPTVTNGYSVKECSDIIWKLHQLAMRMRAKRFQNGALKIDQPKMIFHLNEVQTPTRFTLYIGKESNWMIEEFMLTANILSAKRIYEAYPNTALLRNHSCPHDKSLTNLVEFLEKFGVFIDKTNAGTIYKSMMNYDSGNEISSSRLAVITNLLIKPMTRALYICSSATNNSNEYWHYALNIPFYTHFTSPIRRYADIVVHRLLTNAIELTDTPQFDPGYVKEVATNCNFKKSAAKKASEMSAEFFLKLYLREHGPICSRAVVIDVREKFLDIIDLSTRLTGRCYIDKIKAVEKVEFNNKESAPSIKITWKDTNTTDLIQIFTTVDVELSCKLDNDFSNPTTFTLVGLRDEH